MRQIIGRHKQFPISFTKTGKKQEWMKFLWPAIFLFFLLGIICVNMMNRQAPEGFGVWSGYFIEKFKYSTIQPLEILYYILEERLPSLFLLFVFALTNWGMVAGIVFVSWQSFSAGFSMAAAVIAYGAKGIILMASAMLPQYLLYIPVYIGYFYLVTVWKERSRDISSGRNMSDKKEILWFLTICFMLFGLFITGIFLESYVNPYLLKKILKIF